MSECKSKLLGDVDAAFHISIESPGFSSPGSSPGSSNSSQTEPL